MRIFFKVIEGLLMGTYNLFKGIGKAFQIAIEVIKPKGLFEWVVLLIAVPVPFGVTALFVYKYLRLKNKE
jgi:hypothetical protein